MASRRATFAATSIWSGLRSAPNTAVGVCRRTLTTTTSPETTLSEAHAEAQLTSAPTRPILEYRASIGDASRSIDPTHPLQYRPPPNPFITPIHCTAYAFPSLEPRELVSYPSTHLSLPTRKDILHRAVIFEADASKIGTANTKWRSEVHGSNRKVRPQKGTGSARLGNKKSPMLRGGGVAFGPKPRDFSTDLPKKVYDLAFRTALSHRYRVGELVVVDGQVEIDPELGSPSQYLRRVLKGIGMDESNTRPFFVTFAKRPGLFTALEGVSMANRGKARAVRDVDVKSLLEGGRVVVERNALEWLLQEHEEDLAPIQKLAQWAESAGQTLCKDKPSEALADLLQS